MGVLGKIVSVLLCLAGIGLSYYALTVERKGEAAKQLGEEYEVSVCACVGVDNAWCTSNVAVLSIAWYVVRGSSCHGELTGWMNVCACVCVCPACAGALRHRLDDVNRAVRSVCQVNHWRIFHLLHLSFLVRVRQGIR
jgi:hypothetical protein